MSDQLSSSTEAPRTRMLVFDIMRFFSALCIIWLHTPESRQLEPYITLSRFAVPFFTYASVFLVFLSLERHPEQTFVSYALARFRRIYLMFLVWTAIYVVIHHAASLILDSTHTSSLRWSLLWSGAASHLWFLPFILLACLLANLLARCCRSSVIFKWVIFSVCIMAGVLLALFPRPDVPEAIRYSSGLSYDTSPSLMWGIAFAILYTTLGATYFKSAGMPIIGLAILILFTALGLIYGRHNFYENMAGFGVLLIALWPSTSSKLKPLAYFGPMGLGIYAAHLMFVEGFQDIAAQFGYVRLWWLDGTVWLLATVASLGVVLVFCRWRLTRWLVM